MLRPLRSVRRLPGLKVIVRTLLGSIPDLLNVMVLLMFLFLVFAVLGLQFFQGALRNRCYSDATGESLPEPFLHCAPPEDSAPGAIRCPAGASCLPQAENFRSGLFSFDDIGHALLVVYHQVDTTGWSPTMWAVQDSAGDITWIFFVVIILLVGNLAINLVLAVLVAEFESEDDQAKQGELQEMMEEEAVFQAQQAATARAMAKRKRGNSLAAAPPRPASSTGSSSATAGRGRAASAGASSPSAVRRRIARRSIVSAGAFGAHGYRASPVQAVSPAMPLTVAEAASSRLGQPADFMQRPAERSDPSSLPQNTPSTGLQAQYFTPPASSSISSPIRPLPSRFGSFSIAEATGDESDGDSSSSAGTSTTTAGSDTEELNFNRAPGLPGLGLGTARRDVHVALHVAEADSGSQTENTRTRQATAIPATANKPTKRNSLVLEAMRNPTQRTSLYDPISGVSDADILALPTVRRSQRRSVALARHQLSRLAELQAEEQREMDEAENAPRKNKAAAAAARSSQSGGMTAAQAVAASKLTLSGNGTGAAMQQVPKHPRENTVRGILDGGSDSNRKYMRSSSARSSMAKLAHVWADEQSDSDSEHEKRRPVEQAAAAMAAVVLAHVDSELRQAHEWLVGKPRWVQRLNSLVRSPKWYVGIAALIITNTILLAMEYHGQPAAYGSGLEWGNFVLSVIFTVEMAVKLVALGHKGYARDSFNMFDASLVLISWVDFGVSSAATGGLGALRSIRLLRIGRLLKLLRQFAGLRRLLNTILESLPDIGYVSLLMFLFVTVWAILGVQLFAGKFDSLQPRPEFTFETFGSAFLAVFQLITTDNLHSIFENSVNATGTEFAVVYFVVGHAFGAYIVVSLFVAILLRRFASFDDMEADRSELEQLASQAREREVQNRLERNARSAEVSGLGGMEDTVHALVLTPGHDIVRAMMDRLIDVREERTLRKQALLDQQNNQAAAKREGKALGCIAASNPHRKQLFTIVTSDSFEFAVIASILVSCVFLALDDATVEPDSTFGRAIRVVDIVFAVLFALESAAKMAAMGILTPRSGYLQNSWNRLDFVVVIFGLVALVAPDLSVVRALRALRPLRVAVRSQSIRVVVNALVAAIPSVANVFALTGVTWLIFAIMAVNLMGGALFQCSDAAVTTKTACVGFFNTTQEFAYPNGTLASASVIAEREWDRIPGAEIAHYDNVGASILTLFRVATFSGWAGLMKTAMTTVGPDEAPEPGARPAIAVFFILFCIVCSFFALNLTVTVLLDSFSQLRSIFDGSAFLTQRQRQWLNAKRLITTVELSASASPPKQACRRPCFRLVQHPWFDAGILIAIAANSIILMCSFYGQPAWMDTMFTISNIFFITLFAAEAVSKIIGLGFDVYWRDSWNRFDLLLVLISFAGLALGSGSSSSVVRLFRLFRTARLLRLVRRAETLRRAFSTLVASLPSLWNIGALLVCTFFVFTIMGMQLFGDIPVAETVSESAIHRRQNFRTFPAALQTVWIVTTGDSWEGPMYVAMEHTSDLAAFFFIAIQLVLAFVMLNTFVAVTLEAYADTEEDEGSRLQREGLKSWADVWNSFDRMATRLLRAHAFKLLMERAPPPFGFGESLRSGRLLRRFERLRIPAFPAPAGFRRQHRDDADTLWAKALQTSEPGQVKRGGVPPTASGQGGLHHGSPPQATRTPRKVRSSHLPVSPVAQLSRAENPMAGNTATPRGGSPPVPPPPSTPRSGADPRSAQLLQLRSVAQEAAQEERTCSGRCRRAWRWTASTLCCLDEHDMNTEPFAERLANALDDWGCGCAMCCLPDVGRGVDVQFEESEYVPAALRGKVAQAGRGEATIVVQGGAQSPYNINEVRRQASSRSRGRIMWVLQLEVTLKALASVILGLDVQVLTPSQSRAHLTRSTGGIVRAQTATAQNSMVFLHELFAVQMVERWWRSVAARSLLRQRIERRQEREAADMRMRAKSETLRPRFSMPAAPPPVLGLSNSASAPPSLPPPAPSRQLSEQEVARHRLSLRPGDEHHGKLVPSAPGRRPVWGGGRVPPPPPPQLQSSASRPHYLRPGMQWKAKQVPAAPR